MATTIPLAASHTTRVRLYADRLRELLDALRADPLSERSSIDLVAHIVNNRPAAAHLYNELEKRAATC
jgi:hypothetical protein